MLFICPCCKSEYELTLTPVALAKPKATKKKEVIPLVQYGNSGKIRMTAERYAEIVARYGTELVDRGVFSMDNWMAANGKSYKDYGAALTNWIQRDIDRNPGLMQKMPAVKPEVEKPKFDESHWT